MVVSPAVKPRMSFLLIVRVKQINPYTMNDMCWKQNYIDELKALEVRLSLNEGDFSCQPNGRRKFWITDKR
ncbi:hypothetical protein O9992_11590 [Vibrio lentus]|nr:hypothetical protein [Vibrio lentus]